MHPFNQLKPEEPERPADRGSFYGAFLHHAKVAGSKPRNPCERKLAELLRPAADLEKPGLCA